jgi:putative copper resistance protein D
VKLLGHPLIGPLLVPVLCALLFFGGLGELSLTSPEAGWLLHLMLLTMGALIALPLVDRDDNRSSLALGLALGVGMLELILDAVPGAVLRFQTHVVIPFFTLDRPNWAPSWLDDQHTAGNIAWIVAEVIDLPFLLLVATRWIRADAREAVRIDAELDAASADTPAGTEPATSRPWWLDDPQIRDRYRTDQGPVRGPGGDS